MSAAPSSPAGSPVTGSSGGGRPRLDPHDPAGIDALLSEEELAVRQTVRDFCADKILPHVADWFERGELPGFRLYGRKGAPVRFRLSEIETWLDGCCRVGPTTSGPATRERPGPGTGGVSSHAKQQAYLGRQDFPRA